MSRSTSHHWKKTKRLTLTVLSIWFVFGFLLHVFVQQLNLFTFFGFPFGFYLAAQGSLIVFVLLIFWMNNSQDAIDRDHGVAEDH